MALAIGKLTILIGAGLVGSMLANKNEDGFKVSDLYSGALKILNPFALSKKDNSTNSKPQDDVLKKMVDNLRNELIILKRSPRNETVIVTSNNSGSSKYGVVIIVVVVGYGYIWWKGYKLSDMMFATKRGLSEACAGVSKQLEGVYSSIAATKRHLSSRLDGVDSKIDESMEHTASTREDVSELRGKINLIGTDVQTVHHVVKTLETKISRIEGKQNETNFGIHHLIDFVRSMENANPLEQIEVGPSGLSRPALELLPPTRAVSLLTNSSQEPPSPSASNGTTKKPLQKAITASGLKDLYGIFEEESTQSQSQSHEIEEKPLEPTGSGLVGRKFSGFRAQFLSSMPSFK